MTPRRLLTAGLACIAALMLTVPAAAGPMTAGERQRLQAHLELTESWLASELAGLSEAQLSFRMAPDTWSIRDVVEHLAIAEPQYWKQLDDSLARPLPATAYTPQATDAGILWYGIDRGNRQRTGEARVPDGRFKTAAEAHASFVKLRATMKARATASQEDFRGRQLIDGNMDVYQWFLMISTHAQRHILQIREVKAHAGYPKR
ncbi:MAG: DinB family protein [Vicinamibacterales bacterium]